MVEPTPPLILCIDDDELILELMARYFRARGVTVLKATRALDALTMLGKLETPVQLIFLDLAMPGVSGQQFAEALRYEPSLEDIPIVVVTARVGPHIQEWAAKSKIEEVINKPFDFRQLLDILVAHGIIEE